MKAAILPAVGEALVVREVELTGPQEGEVRVRMAATGVCRSDLSMQDSTLPHPLPCVPGHEGSGVVVEVGPGVDDVAIGDHVILSWIVPCGHCRFCLGGQANLCPDSMSAMGTNHIFADGVAVTAGMGTATFAEETIVPSGAAIRIEDDVPLDVAALIGCGVTTGVGAALNTARVTPGARVAVIGCGGVGVNVIQGARIAGAAEIVAVDTVAHKREAAAAFGATAACDPEGLRTAAGDGFDFTFDVVGTPATIRAAWDATRRGGTTVVVGAGRMDTEVAFSPFELFYMERTLKGCVYGSADVRRDFHRFLDLWRSGRLELASLISHRIGLEAVNDAFTAMEAGSVLRTLIQFD